MMTLCGDKQVCLLLSWSIAAICPLYPLHCQCVCVGIDLYQWYLSRHTLSSLCLFSLHVICLQRFLSTISFSFTCTYVQRHCPWARLSLSSVIKFKVLPIQWFDLIWFDLHLFAPSLRHVTTNSQWPKERNVFEFVIYCWIRSSLLPLTKFSFQLMLIRCKKKVVCSLIFVGF